MAELDKREGKGKDVSRRRKLISGTNAVVVVLATIGIAVVANAMVSQMSRVRVDLTENNIYTLSEPSREVVRELEEPVEVKAFISGDMPPPHHTLRRRVKDMLTEYSAAAGDTLDFQIISPGDDRQTEQTAKGYGCEKVGIGQRGKDEVSLRAVYKCIAFVQGDTQEVITDLKTSGNPAQDNFEYEFTKALMNLTDREPRKVTFVAGFGGPADQRGFVQGIEQTFSQLYGDLIKPSKVDLSSTTDIPEDVSALVILNPDKKFSGKAKWAIDQFIQRGGSVGWYQSATGIDRQMRRRMMQQMGNRRQLPEFRKPIDPGLSEFIGDYGLKLRQDVVLDRENALAMGMVMTDRGLAQISHPASFTIPNIDRTLPFTRDVGMMALPAPSSIQIKASARDDEAIEVHEVLKTAATAVRRPGAPTSLSYQNLRDPIGSEEKDGPYVVAAALQGDLPSYYANNPRPEGVEEPAAEEGGAEEATANSRLLVVGSGEFYRPVQSVGYSQQLAGMGGQFLLSSIEWLVQDSALTQIRGKSMPRLIGEVDNEKKRAIQFINIACVPAFFALIGVGMMYRRRRRREKLKWSE